MNLYELTRKLVARGCPEHPRVSYYDKESIACGSWILATGVGSVPCHPDTAKSEWTMWALEWWGSFNHEGQDPQRAAEQLYDDMFEFGRAAIAGELLESIEAATRHLQQSNRQINVDLDRRPSHQGATAAVGFRRLPK